jgi:SAM-dependent methyltransferase
MIDNPFIENSEIALQSVIPKKRLIDEYQSRFNIDVNGILGSVDSVELYKCKKSGYKFYYPFNITGDSQFYQKLQQLDYYYMPWKWEHQVCSGLIKEGDKVLEVGCGTGDFIRTICKKNQDIQVVGLELNESCVVAERNYKIINKTIEDFSADNVGQFDLVCTFQVLEHIAFVNSFLKAQIKCVKKDGLLVISVPNNGGFLKNEKFEVLNMPPHHMGLWDEESLRMIGSHFNLELIKVEFEPLQEYHFDWYLDLMVKKMVGDYIGSYFVKVINFVRLRFLIKKIIKSRAHKIQGHSILIVLKKNN